MGNCQGNQGGTTHAPSAKKKISDKKIILGYWGIKGRSQAMRDFMEYLKIPYENKLYYNPSDWYEKDRPLIENRTIFFNLPYLDDDGVLVTESDAIFFHLAVRAGKRELVAPKAGEDLVCLAVLRGNLIDLFTDLYKAAISPDFTAAMELFNKSIAPRLARISKHLGKNEWLVNGKLTYADFMFYEIFKAILKQDESLIDENLKGFVKRFESLPAIKDFQASDRFVDAPFLSPTMVFLNK